MTEAVIALGSNLGDRAANLRAAITLMAEAGITTSRRSSIWETEPVPADQPRFLNAVVAAETAFEPEGILAELKRIEHELGRRPERRWGPRPMDLDILFYGAAAFESTTLIIPHPRIAERAFVLAPLAEVCRGPLPVLRKSPLELLAGMDAGRAVRTTLGL